MVERQRMGMASSSIPVPGSYVFPLPGTMYPLEWVQSLGIYDYDPNSSDLQDQRPQNLQEFFDRHPVDRRAEEYLCTRSAEVQTKAFREFKPPHEMERDYSSLLTSSLSHMFKQEAKEARDQ